MSYNHPLYVEQLKICTAFCYAWVLPFLSVSYYWQFTIDIRVKLHSSSVKGCHIETKAENLRNDESISSGTRDLKCFLLFNAVHLSLTWIDILN